MQPYLPVLDECYKATNDKSCHILGARYFFGEYIMQNLDVTESEREFGAFYRQTYGDLIKNGSSEVLGTGANNWTRLSIEELAEPIGKPMQQQCRTFNQIGPDGSIYTVF